MSRLYKTYLFKDKDPVIDLLRTVVKDTGIEFSEIAERSGVSHQTIARWFYGDTKRPQHASVAAVARALGYDFRLTPILQEKPKLVVDNGNIRGKTRQT